MSSRVTETPTTSRATNRWLILVAGVLVQFTSVPLISVAAGSASDVGYSTAAAASLVGVLGLFNGGGRISWGWLSDRIGKMPAFMGILGPGRVPAPHPSRRVAGLLRRRCPRLHVLRRRVRQDAVDGATVLRRPQCRSDLRTDAHRVSIGGIVGLQLISSLIGERKAYTLAFTLVGLSALVGMALPMLTKKPAPVTAPEARDRSAGRTPR